jgi:hypothetical protein
MEQLQEGWAARAWALRRRGVSGALAPLGKLFAKLKRRYGPRYTYAMVLVAFLALFSPIPGSTAVVVALVVAVAEAHRAVSQRGGFAEAAADLIVMVKANLPFWATGRWAWPRP